MRREIKQVYKRTKVFQVESLRKNRTFWQRRLTIAQNKLKEVDDAMATLADELAREIVDRDAKAEEGAFEADALSRWGKAVKNDQPISGADVVDWLVDWVTVLQKD